MIKSLKPGEIHQHKVGGSRCAGRNDPDPFTTQIIRHSLNSVAEQMARHIKHAAFSQPVAEMNDFAVAIYDREVRLLAEGAVMPMFMGSLSFCVETAVENCGGETELEPGDIIVYNDPYGSGTHPPDACLIMPIFLNQNKLVGYSIIKTHWLDVGGVGGYCANTIDVHQEGVIFPGLKLYRRGELQQEIWRLILSNSRTHATIQGDILAQVAGVRIGAKGLTEIIEKFGKETFDQHVEHMFDYGEALVRRFFEKIPDGVYQGCDILDNDGVMDAEVPVDITVKVDGSNICFDYSEAVDAVLGPVNSPMPMTVAVSRVALTMLAGGRERINEGFFRPLEVITRAGSLFHPLRPSACFMYFTASYRAMNAAYRALSDALPGATPACDGADPCILALWGTREETGVPWFDGWAMLIGHGAHAGGDGATYQNTLEAASRMPPIEVWESIEPWLFESQEIAPDSGGAGQFQGGNGVNLRLRVLENCYLTSTLDHINHKPWGLLGGKEARSNKLILHKPDGSSEKTMKVTGKLLEKGTVIEQHTAGGGGYGVAAERDPESVKSDLADGYISEAFAQAFYPHAL